jgi:WD40 repeat protein
LRAGFVSVSLSSDGKYVAVGTFTPPNEKGGDLLLWRLDEPKKVQKLFISKDYHYITVVDFHPTEPLLASGHRDGYVRIWDVTTGKEALQRLQACGVACRCAAWSPDGQYLLGGGGAPGYGVTIWDRNGKRIAATPWRKLPSDLNCAAWSRDGKHFATGGGEHEVTVYDFPALTVAARVRGHVTAVKKMGWGPHQLVSVADNTGLISRPLAVVEPASAITNTTQLVYVAWSPDGRMLAGASVARELYLWDAATHRLLKTFPDARRHRGVAWSPDSKEVATVNDLGVIVVRDVATGDVRLRLQSQQTKGLIEAGLQWSPDRRWIAVCGDVPIVEVYDVAAGELRYTYKQPASAVAFSPDSRWLGIGDKSEPMVYLADMKDGSKVEVFRSDRGAKELAWDPSGCILASASGDGSLNFYDIHQRKLIVKQPGMKSVVRGLSWSTDGRRIAAADNDETIVIWDAATLDRLLTLPAEGTVRSIAWSPDGRHLAAWGKEGLRIFGSLRMPTLPSKVDHWEGGILASVRTSPVKQEK